MQATTFFVKKGGKELGEGGFGIVLKQEINGVGRAVKWLNGKVKLSLIQEEAQAMAALDNQNLVRFVGLAMDGDSLGLVLELMTGGDLFCYLHDPSKQSVRPLTPDTQKKWSLQITNGLDYIHSQQIVHRDMKSLNVLLSGDLTQAKISDFGLAKVKSMSKGTAGPGSLAGTILYFAPELKQGKKNTFKSDIFALGLVLYEIFTRKMIDDVVEDEDVDENIADPHLAQIIRRCLHYERQQRPDCSQVVAALQSVTGEIPVSQHPYVSAVANLDSITDSFFWRDSKTSSPYVSARASLSSVIEAPNLHEATRKGNLQMCRDLIAAGADVNVTNSHGETPLHVASSSGQIGVCRLLMEKGGWPGVRNASGKTPLDVSMNPSVLETIQSFMRPDLNSDLLESVKKGELSKCRFLLNQGADVNAKDKWGWTALCLAVESGHLEICKLLVQSRAAINLKNNSGEIALHRAAGEGHLEICKLLVQARSDIHGKDKYGGTPLHKAATHGHLAICELFVESGADVSAKDNSGATPLPWAASMGSRRVCRFLLENGADVNTTNNKGWTPLHYAAEQGILVLCKFLVLNGVDVGARSQDGKTAAMIAFGKHAEVYDYLKNLPKEYRFDTVDSTSTWANERSIR